MSNLREWSCSLLSCLLLLVYLLVWFEHVLFGVCLCMLSVYEREMELWRWSAYTWSMRWQKAVYYGILVVWLSLLHMFSCGGLESPHVTQMAPLPGNSPSTKAPLTFCCSWLVGFTKETTNKDFRLRKKPRKFFHTMYMLFYVLSSC